MISSMTAFAREQLQINGISLCWEIRSVNHRYLDVSFRLPDSLRFLEPRLRPLLAAEIQRGKLECQLKYQDENNDKHAPILVNTNLVTSLVQLSNNLAQSHHLTNDLSTSQVLAWPGVLCPVPLDTNDLANHATNLFARVVNQLVEARIGEGKAVREHIQLRLINLETQLKQAQELVAVLAAGSKEKLYARLSSIQIELPEARIEQEIALILTRMDVSEELDRLQIHLHEVTRLINSGKLVGRKLDFLMQELNREANTLSSKSDSVELTQIAVEMKVLIEQMREQIQNIE